MSSVCVGVLVVTPHEVLLSRAAYRWGPLPAGVPDGRSQGASPLDPKASLRQEDGV